MSDLKPISIYYHGKSPNPWKAVIIFEELGLPYTLVEVDFAVIKEEPYISVNPNGRLPAIEDPNTGITLWESGAIVEYLVETYDKAKKLTVDSFPEKYHLKQYLHFQMSGQGPYYGQLGWFKMFHQEKIESAISRYEEQVFRVVSVLDSILKDKEYLVGGKFTYADAAFVPWENTAHIMLKDKLERYKEYPHYSAWLERLYARPSVQKYIAATAEPGN